MEEIVYILSFWIIYSFFGWIIEVIYCTFKDGYFVNRGFLNGPCVPIYGFGALIILYFLDRYIDNLFYIFMFGVILTSALEYFTSWFLEVCFKLKLWDYSKYFMNLNGRICLLNSTLFGLLCVVLVKFIHPVVDNFIYKIDFNVLKNIVMIILILMLADFVFSVLGTLGLKNRLIKADELRLKFEQSNQKLKRSFIKKLGKLKYNEKRILKSFPHIKSEKFQYLLEEIKNSIKK